MKAEIECSLISLECCKEVRQKLELSLQECCEDKSKIEAELVQVKELLDRSSTLETSLLEMPNGESVDRDLSSNHKELSLAQVLLECTLSRTVMIVVKMDFRAAEMGGN
ncbi:hypothetical protein SAY86_004309 [Trapa natans]|uniref:Uncharacterized protein n=1 Tax=Trapa natans TaxID=22666 RepID=A0AAN7MFJ4_TRANT|nr:hypothetical protein SAY86_004309 [Trapa natans]